MENHTEFENTLAEFTMIAIEGNTESEPFKIGGESWNDNALPIYYVKIDNYYIGEYPVTQKIWKNVMNSNPSFSTHDNRPVEQVSWSLIIEEFLPILNIKTQNSRPPDTFYRLPTEVEWEFAAKGGLYCKRYDFHYSGSEKLNEVSWHEKNSQYETKPVGLKTPNLLGLYDMSGNVWEWCIDEYSTKYYEECSQYAYVENPCYIENIHFSKVNRGGSYKSIDNLRHCTTFRDFTHFENKVENVGLRLVLSHLNHNTKNL